MSNPEFDLGRVLNNAARRVGLWEIYKKKDGKTCSCWDEIARNPVLTIDIFFVAQNGSVTTQNAESIDLAHNPGRVCVLQRVRHHATRSANERKMPTAFYVLVLQFPGKHLLLRRCKHKTHSKPRQDPQTQVRQADRHVCHRTTYSLPPTPHSIPWAN